MRNFFKKIFMSIKFSAGKTRGQELIYNLNMSKISI